MTHARLFFASWLLLLASSVSAASLPEGGVALQSLLAQSKDLYTTRNEALASNYPGTECVDVSFRKSSAKVGIICVSKNKNFATEMGISEYEALPEGSRPKDRPKSGLVIGTPMRQYEMRTFNGPTSGAAAAVVDCDTDGAAIYRATSSCHVAVSALGEHEFVYSNFVLTYHKSRQRGISQRRIEEVWLMLAKRAH
jgi:hypothetical protein